MSQIIIVGGGYAAGELAFGLRRNGYAEPITILSGEAHLPYHRPPLSKTFLAGQTTRDALLVRPQASFDKADIRFRASTWARSIDRHAHTVELTDGEKLPYRAVVLATGGHARRLNCPGADLARICLLRTIDDVETLQGHLQPGARLVIVGGGYIGLEVAAVAIKHGLSVTLVETAPRLLARVTGPEISGFYETAHREAGVELHLGATVEQFLPNEDDPTRVGHVVLGDGSTLPADFVIAGVGLIPHVELAEACGLPVQNGIVVDEYCRTEDPAILAIGDCSNHPSAFLGRRVRLESVPNALEQARVAADTLCGKLVPYQAVPWFWSDQYDLKLQAVGLSENYDRVVLRGDMAARSFLLFYLRQGRVIAADAVNKPGEFMIAKRLTAEGATPDPAALADPSVALKSLLATKPVSAAVE